jgi:hypothetical protein
VSAEKGIPARPRRRRRWLVPVVVAIAVLAYVVVVLLYASSGRFVSVGAQDAPDPQAVTVKLQPSGVSAVAERIDLQVEVQPPDDLTEGQLILTQDVSVIISPVDGDQGIDLAKGSIPPSTSVSVVAPGVVEEWPFDSYHQKVGIVGFTTSETGERVGLPTAILMDGGVPGWNIKAFIDETTDYGTVELADGSEQKIAVVDITATRSGSTLAFAVLLLGLMIVMPALVLFVAITAFRGKRKVEATLMSWMGAMLFATIPLRTFLPGSPPIGSWIDFLIVLWVIVGLIAGLVIYVSAWMRWGTPASPRTPPDVAG